MKGKVYSFVNKLDGKRYIGFTNRPLQKRIWEHISAAKLEKYQSPFLRALKKHGIDQFDVSVLYEGEDALEKEIEFVKLMGDYNVAPGGGFIPSKKGIPLSEAHKQALRKPKRCINRRPPMSEAAKDKIRETLKMKGIKPPSRLGVRLTEEQKQERREKMNQTTKTTGEINHATTLGK